MFFIKMISMTAYRPKETKEAGIRVAIRAKYGEPVRTTNHPVFMNKEQITCITSTEIIIFAALKVFLPKNKNTPANIPYKAMVIVKPGKYAPCGGFISKEIMSVSAPIAPP